MKTLFCLLALSAVIAHSAVLDDKSARNNINIGGVYSGDRLLARSTLYRQAVANTIQSEDFVFRGNRTTRISAIRATEQGRTQRPTIRIVSGGLGYANATLRVQSLRGYGYHYLVDIWGR